MGKLLFLVAWNKNKKSTWSGTCWGLYTALQNYFKINDIDVNLTKFDRLILRLKKILFHFDDQFGLNEILIQRKKVKKHLLKKSKNIVFQFAEIIPNASNVDSYIYIDEDVNHVKHLYEKELNIFRKSNFSNANIQSINKRNDSQLSYFANCSGIFTMGMWLRNSIVERLGVPADRVHCVGGGINLDPTLIENKYKQHNKILFVGRDFERKGGYLVIDAFNKLKKNKSDKVELHIAGPCSNPLRENIEGIYYHGDCNPNKITELMNMCDVFCMPSYYEAYGLVFIEALVYGLPCIGRNAYEMPYFIEEGKTGLLINEDDSEDLAKKMYILLNDHSFAERVKEKQEFYIKKYSWNSVANNIFNIINKDSSN